jgi:hypothetical protein
VAALLRKELKLTKPEPVLDLCNFAPVLSAGLDLGAIAGVIL